MATVAITRSTIDQHPYPLQKVVWTPLNATDTVGAAYTTPGSGDRSVQVTGTFDTGTLVFQGTNDGTNWVTLTDPLGNPISLTAAGLKQVSEFTAQVRPSLSGAGTDSITITLITRVTKT